MNLSPSQTRALAWVALSLVAWGLLHLLSPVLMPFVLAAVLGYALHPLVEKMCVRRIPRWLGAGVALVLLGAVVLAVLLLFSALTFVPTLYLYPSYRGPFSRATQLFCLVWAVVLTLLATDQFEDPVPVIWASTSFPVYYLLLSWGITIRRWRQLARDRAGRARGDHPPAGTPQEREGE